MTNTSTQLMDIATRIRGMREILGYSTQKMAEQTERRAFRSMCSENPSPTPAWAGKRQSS